MAFVAAHVLCGRPLAWLKLPAGRAIPESVLLEGDAAVDDIEIALAGGGRAWVQVKTKLGRQQFGKCTAQWTALAQQTDLDPRRHRVMAAAALGTQEIVALQEALERNRRALAASPTGTHVEALAILEKHLRPLSPEDRSTLLACAGIWIADFRRGADLSEQLAAQLLEGQVVEPGEGGSAWTHLRDHVRELAGDRFGATAEDLLGLLRDAGFHLRADATGARAAQIEARRRVMSRYRAAVAVRGEQIDLGVGGTRLPPLPLADLDMDVKATPAGPPVHFMLAWEHSAWALPWLMRGHGRALLTAPPGAGKSVALRAAAAFYARRDDWPLPLVVPLPRFRARRKVMGNLDALVEVALDQEPAADRAVLSAAAHEALAAGTAAIFFDGLDETRADRRKIVAGIREALGHVAEGVEVLLTTREVGYADAEVLDFFELELVPPGRPERTIDIVLTTVAERTVPLGQRGAWVAERVAWAGQRMADDHDLRLTPLSVVLLALLAAEDGPARLPGTRAAILSRVVRDIIGHWEVERRSDEQPIVLGALGGDEALAASWDAFAAIGHHLVHTVGPTFDTARGEVGRLLAERWGLSPARAKVAAAAAIDLWDEQGIFIKSGPGEDLAPRIPTLADLGDAVFAAEHLEGDARASWLAEELDQDAPSQALTLAVTLSAAVVEDTLSLAVADSSLHRLRIAVRAVSAVSVPEATMLALADRLLGRPAEDDGTRWAIAEALGALPVPVADQAAVLEYAERLPPFPHRLLRALTALRWQRSDEEARADLRQLIETPPRDLVAPPGETDDAAVADHLREVVRLTYLRAAERMLGPSDEPLAKAIWKARSSLVDVGQIEEFARLLAARGYEDLVVRWQDEADPENARWREVIRAEEAGETITEHEWHVDDSRREQHVIDQAIILELAEPAELTSVQQRSVASLAEILHTLDFYRVGQGYDTSLQRTEPYKQVVAALIWIAGHEPAVLARQVLVLREIEAIEGFGAVQPMLSGRQAMKLRIWPDEPSALAAVKVMTDALAGPVEWLRSMAFALLPGVSGLARVACVARCQMLATEAEGHALRALVQMAILLDRREQRFHQAATDPRAAARIAAAAAVCVRPDGWRTELPVLLQDPDGGVRQYAISAIELLKKENEFAEAIARAKNDKVAWQCLHCGSSNAADDRCACGAWTPAERDTRADLFL